MAKGRLFLIHWHAEEAEQIAAPLRKDGWDVDVEAEDGARAAKAILAAPPDAVIVYLTRKASHARETMHHVHSSKAGRAIPIIFVGGEEAVVKKTRLKLRDATYVAEPALKRTLAQYASI
jgi:DNA-binding response OmpR family regulator